MSCLSSELACRHSYQGSVNELKSFSKQKAYHIEEGANDEDEIMVDGNFLAHLKSIVQKETEMGEETEEEGYRGDLVILTRLGLVILTQDIRGHGGRPSIGKIYHKHACREWTYRCPCTGMI